MLNPWRPRKDGADLPPHDEPLVSGVTIKTEEIDCRACDGAGRRRRGRRYADCEACGGSGKVAAASTGFGGTFQILTRSDKEL